MLAKPRSMHACITDQRPSSAARVSASLPECALVLEHEFVQLEPELAGRLAAVRGAEANGCGSRDLRPASSRALPNSAARTVKPPPVE